MVIPRRPTNLPFLSSAPVQVKRVGCYKYSRTFSKVFYKGSPETDDPRDWIQQCASTASAKNLFQVAVSVKTVKGSKFLSCRKTKGSPDEWEASKRCRSGVGEKKTVFVYAVIRGRK